MTLTVVERVGTVVTVLLLVLIWQGIRAHRQRERIATLLYDLRELSFLHHGLHSQYDRAVETGETDPSPRLDGSGHPPITGPWSRG